MRKKRWLRVITLSSLFITTGAIASSPNYDAMCRGIYPQICKDEASCNAEEKISFDKLHSFCKEVIKPNNFLDEALKELFVMEQKVVSDENKEALKRTFPELKKKTEETEAKIVDGVNLVRSYLKVDPEFTMKFNNKTNFLNKETAISNSKGFLIYVMKDNNIDSYREFYKNKIKTNSGEKSISDFKDQVLTKKECVNLMFHTLKTYKLNEGLDAIREVTDLLDKQNVKCK